MSININTELKVYKIQFSDAKLTPLSYKLNENKF